METLGYVQRVVDSILRNNPLTNAVTSHGLMKWLGNYNTAGTSSKINFLWIGEFLPADPNLPGTPPQRGFSLVRDDSRGGISAISMYDPYTGIPGGLKQILQITSGDSIKLFEESRDGGWRWPEEEIPMGGRDSNLASWPGTDQGTFGTLYEGRANIRGNVLAYRFVIAGTNGGAGDFQFVVNGGTVIGPTHSVGVNGFAVADSTVDVTQFRGKTVQVELQARRTTGTGTAKVNAVYVSVRSFTP
jgi:hypothetical protein